MNLDMRTTMLLYLLVNVVSAAFIAALWQQNRKRLAGISFWLADMVLQVFGSLLLVLRGLVPDFMSMTLANTMIVVGILVMLIGLERFTGEKSRQVHNYVLLFLFVASIIYYAYFQPDLTARTLSIAAITLILTFQCYLLLIHRVDANMRRTTYVVGIIFGLYALISAVRIILIFLFPLNSSDFFKSGIPDISVIMLYIMLTAGLGFSLILMVNKRLLYEVQIYSEDLEAKKNLLNETGKMAKVGGWEFDVGTRLQTWTDEVYRIHEMEMDHQPTVDEGLSFFLLEAKPTITEALQKAMERGEPFDLELPFITAKGNSRWVHAIGRAYRKDGKIFKVGGTLQDITERKTAENGLKKARDELSELATHDILTKLPNRRLLYDRFDVALANAKRNNNKLVVMFLDLDRFKTVNDSLGHDIGDSLLIAAAERLTGTLRKGDTVTRIGGDEFVLLVSEIASKENAVKVAEKILNSFRQPFVIDNNKINVTVSIGIAMYPDNGDKIDELLKISDQALYTAKQNGRDRVVL